MKNKKIIISIIVMLMLFFQTTTIQAASFSDSYIDQTYTTKMNSIASDMLSDSSKEIMKGYNLYIINVPVRTIVPDTPTELSVGNVNFDKKEVIVNNYWNSISTAFHEMGHVLDYDPSTGYTGKYSLTTEYQNIASEETSKILPYSYENPEFFKTKITEQFAESFSLYVMIPNILKEIAPKTYDYFSKLNLIKEDFNSYSMRMNITTVLDPSKTPIAVDGKKS
jgi:hypothetical protein